MGIDNKQFYGIEVEREHGSHLRVSTESVEQAGWEIHTDGSLRNAGVEFVTRSPASYPAVRSMLAYLYNSPCITDTAGSWRCGIHIHINTAGRSRAWRLRLLVAYLACERYLFSMADGTMPECEHDIIPRSRSRFAEPLQGMPFHDLVWAWLAEPGQSVPAAANMGTHKYSGLFMGKMATRQSAELRMFSGSMKYGAVLSALRTAHSLARWASASPMTHRIETVLERGIVGTIISSRAHKTTLKHVRASHHQELENATKDYDSLAVAGSIAMRWPELIHAEE